ncbi:uncharacterized protein PAC_19953 [Phialocephala subalpina]|uniref:Transcription factor domain-containing protein n=1 Tax=Phialocephala subalpina TaxID=576137 RepID=A0A1L7XYA0_9HELO|nr:uncharacterized protein PAC_19953 [Phialocephala subalpina]
MSERLEKLEQMLESVPQRSNPSSKGWNLDTSSVFESPLVASCATHAMFPATYFLDFDAYHQIPASQLNPEYFGSTQTWLPILSKKRLAESVNSFSTAADAGLALLLLCMKLMSQPSEEKHATKSSLYGMSALIAIYEIGHGRFLAGYLTLSHASREKDLVGDCDSRSVSASAKLKVYQCSKLPVVLTVLLHIRYVNIGTRGMPLLTPEPLQGTLLPCKESSWDQGEIGLNEPLFASSFGNNPEIGLFASTCQASHILGLVLRHRDEHRSGDTDPHFRLSEALRLHQTLVALDNHLDPQVDATVAAALCYSARLVLYNIYACNENYSTIGRRIQEETEMQRASINGLREVSQKVYQLAQQFQNAAIMNGVSVISQSLLLCNCLYQAAGEWAWFVREEKSMDGRMGDWTDDLADEYLKNLEGDGTLALVE